MFTSPVSGLDRAFLAYRRIRRAGLKGESRVSKRKRVGSLCIAVLVAGAMFIALPVTAQTDPRQGLTPGTDNTNNTTQIVPNADAATAAFNVDHLAWRSKPVWAVSPGAFNQSNIGSDLAFKDNYALLGNYLGFGVIDISEPDDPTLVTIVNCVGGQGDLSVYGNLLFQSVESKRSDNTCASSTLGQGWAGIRIYDITDVTNPQYVGAVNTCRGSHTHTVVEDPNDDENVYIYVSGTAAVRTGTGPWQMGCINTPTGNNPDLFLDADGNPVPTSRFQVEVIKVPLAAPQNAAIVNEARLMKNHTTNNPHGLWAGGNHGTGTQSTTATDACHDITAYPEIGLAAGACEGNGILIDISDPANPVRIDEVLDPNFAYWHSATFNNDGTKVVFTDEWGGGVQARCRPQDPVNWGADAIFDIVQTEDGPKMEFRAHYKVPNVQANNETCVAHNGSLVPVPGRDIMVQAWYEGGLSVWDFTDSSNPVEIAFFDRGPYHPTQMPAGGYWSVYHYNGNIYGNEIFLGFDSFKLTPSDFLSEAEIAASDEVVWDEFNAQAQVAFSWGPSANVVGAYRDQLVRSGDISDAAVLRVNEFLDAVDAAGTARQMRAAANLGYHVASRLDADTQGDLIDAITLLADDLDAQTH